MFGTRDSQSIAKEVFRGARRQRIVTARVIKSRMKIRPKGFVTGLGMVSFPEDDPLLTIESARFAPGPGPY